MQKLMTNLELWDLREQVEDAFSDDKDLILPIKVNYALQVNRKMLEDKFLAIEKVRLGIGKKYGTPNEENNSYKINSDKIELAQMELNQLMEIQQSVDIMAITLQELEGIKLNMPQMQAILFMIQKEE